MRSCDGNEEAQTSVRSVRYLSFAEREEIAILYAREVAVREIARRLDRSPSTISREVRRDAATPSGVFTYRATTAQWHAYRRAKRPKVAKLASNDALRHCPQERRAGTLTAPDGRAVPGPGTSWNCRRHNSARIDDESMRISHEAIYQALYIQGRGAGNWLPFYVPVESFAFLELEREAGERRSPGPKS
jgi:IS30 family transposase